VCVCVCVINTRIIDIEDIGNIANTILIINIHYISQELYCVCVYFMNICIIIYICVMHLLCVLIYYYYNYYCVYKKQLFFVI